QRLQPFKQPELFLKAAVAACRRHSVQADVPPVFAIVSYGWDRKFIADLRALIPRDLADRVLFLENLPEGARSAVLRSGAAVFPSVYESLCLAAVECLQHGRPIVLNRDCLAFTENPFFSAT